MGRRPSVQPKPPCPEHAGSHVVFDGLYGPREHRRQRYRCYPAGCPGGDYHRFTEVLPRQTTVAGVCAECERHVHPSEGPPTPRRYDFTARDVARALLVVGAGESYRAASAASRRSAERMPIGSNGQERYSRHGQLVGDWVSLFAPVVFEPHRRSAWPTDGSIVLDHVGFRIHDYRPDGTPKAGPVAFNVLAALGYEKGAPFLWKLAASPTAGKQDWVEFLRGVGGTPQRVVTDGHDATIAASAELWPDAVHWRSEWHLRAAFYDELVATHQHGDTRLHRTLKQAFINRYFWESFTVVAHRYGSDKLNRLVKRHEPLILDQFRRRPDASRARTNPLTTGGLEPRLGHLKAWLTPRAHGLLNRPRLDCLLMLMQMQLNGQANEPGYSRALRDWLTAHDGRPTRTRRWATEPFGTASLRAPGARQPLTRNDLQPQRPA